MLTSHSTFRVVWRGTLFLILKSASMVDSMGENSIFPSSAVASSSRDSICNHMQIARKPSFHGALASSSLDILIQVYWRSASEPHV